MKARCPKSEEHGAFSTTAHVVEEWMVDEHGDFVEHIATLETTHGPDPDNTWTCMDCGAAAEVTA